MKAVTNSSVLIALSLIDQLQLLNQKFNEGVFVPQAVWREVVIIGGNKAGAERINQASWLQVKDVTNQASLASLGIDLDEGEAAAIALFLQEPADFILLDEKKARQVARLLNLPTIGTVGILIWAKQNGLILSLKESLDLLKNVRTFRLSQSIYEGALKAVGELK